MDIDDVVLTHRPATRTGHPVVLLAAAEGRRMARHPVLLLAVVASGLLLRPWLNGEPAQNWSTQNYVETLGSIGLPVYFAAFVLGNLAALRERPSTTAEMFLGMPTTYAERTRAILLAGLVPVAVSAIIAAAYEALVIKAGGITVGDQPATIRLTPTIVELALIPAITATCFTAGIAIARTARSRVTGMILGTVLTAVLVAAAWVWGWFPAYFLAPITSGLRRDNNLGLLSYTEMVTAGQQKTLTLYDSGWWPLAREVDRVGWHVTYLLGVTVLLAGYALMRSGGDRRVRLLLTTGCLLVVAGLVGQLVVYGGPVSLFGDVGAT